ncbi:MAG TPA: RtcB family protein [Dehalococcoidia bacterium]|nr:RtcB family protein [Dehalococcoidia bacterium]
METAKLERKSECEWWIAPTGKMRVPAVIYATESLILDMDEKVREQITNVATLPGIVKAAYCMPDAHWGYGFPIGGVAAFDPKEGGIISAGGVGFDVSCGVRTLHTGLKVADVEVVREKLAEALFRAVPAGLGSRGDIHLDIGAMKAMLRGGARWAVGEGYGQLEDLDFIEEAGTMIGAVPDEVSEHALKRQQDEMGTLGSGNHYLEVQRVAEVFDEDRARIFRLGRDDVVVSIHCGSRGLGHQIGTEYLKQMVVTAASHGIELPDRELACAPIASDLGESYLGAMRAAINCALANRQIITHLVREAFASVFPDCALPLIYDVSHNTCKVERHAVDGETRELYVHRKGATRAFGPGHVELPPPYRGTGQPVIIGGTMGTASHVLVGTTEGEALSFSSSCHGAGRSMSRHEALKHWQGRSLVDSLASQGIIIKTRSYRGVAEEAPGAYKDVGAVAEAAHQSGLSRKVARLTPLICIKG